MDRTLRRTLTVLLASLALVACNRCGHPRVASSGRSPAELAPPDARVVVYASHVLALGQKVQHLSTLKAFGLAATLAGAGDSGAALINEAKQQIGFDFTTREGLQKVGIDPDGPLLSASSGKVALLVAGVGDATRLDGAVAVLAKERLRAPSRTERDGITSFSPSTGAPVLAYARQGSLAVMATGAGCVEAVAAALKRDSAHSLAGNSAYAAFVAAHAGSDLMVWAPDGVQLRDLDLHSGLALAWSLEPHRTRIELELPLTTAQATALASLHGSAGSDLVGQLDPDAFVVARTAIDPAQLWPVVQAFIPPQLAAAFAKAGVHPTAALADLRPGAALSLALPASMDLARMPSFDPRETNPFHYVYLAALGSLRDPATATKTLAQVASMSNRFGATLVQKPLGKAAVYTFKYALGEGASIALAGNRLAVAGGDGRMAALLSRAADGGAHVPPELAPAFSKAGLAVWLDLPRLVRSLRALPDSSFGLGGFAIKAAMNRWLDAIDDIRGVLLLADTRADSRGSTLHVELQAELP